MFKKEDLKDLLDLLNRLSMQMRYVSEVDEIVYEIVSEKIALVEYPKNNLKTIDKM